MTTIDNILGEGQGSVTLMDFTANIDLLICQSARVQPGAPWRPDKSDGSPSDPGLIRYMLKNGHSSPFEHGLITVALDAPLFVLVHLLRHRFLSPNEQSARYEQLAPRGYIPAPDHVGRQHGANHQSRVFDGVSRPAMTLARPCAPVCFDAWEATRR
jgi:thymidylate synthase (FAD)